MVSLMIWFKNELWQFNFGRFVLYLHSLVDFIVIISQKEEGADEGMNNTVLSHTKRTSE